MIQIGNTKSREALRALTLGYRPFGPVFFLCLGLLEFKLLEFKTSATDTALRLIDPRKDVNITRY